ncbi:PAC2 family-domain-containing protein [Multifurca ochricompacta]|uniref:Proteasome assembly chaperone 2 n=1 Tax=Multifurca ochricompacta TaxID=376703 RepID=A0AAD4QPL9_9AGAM|nr:PAC2 family-domain-containing protein [Multifurca ochricompacta]
MPFYYPITPFNLHEKALVVPVVSAANIAQLAVDLLIASLSLRAIGIFDPRDLVPVVGGREDGREGVTTPLELWGREGCEIVVVQQRPPQSKKQEFIDALLQFVRESNLSAALFLSGVDMTNRTDAQMATPIYYIHPPSSPAWEGSLLSSISQLPIPEYTSPIAQHPGASQNEGPIPFIPGGGLMRRILSNLPAGWAVPTAALLQFVLEGDNRSDASLMAAAVARVLSLEVQEWRQPLSWQQGFFGTPHDQTLYG